MLRSLAVTIFLSVALTLGCCSSTVRADLTEPPTPMATPSLRKVLSEREKIDRMLEILATSDAVFIRNGEEHNGADAAAHLRGKLSAAGGLIPSARAFIEQLASRSSASGRPYQVRPKGGAAVESGKWFTNLLTTIEAPPAIASDDLAGADASSAAPGALGADLVITVDATEAPELKEWGDKAKAICQRQYPIICALLDSEGFKPRSAIKIVFKGSMRAPAATGGDTISVNAPYVLQHTDDYGMMVHELTHVVQAYHRGRPNTGWLTEGIADYIRFYKYEPGADHSRIDTTKATYHDSYRTTAAFLNFVAEKYDKDLVKKLNALMREGEADETSFKPLVDKDVNELWKEFVESLEAKRNKTRDARAS